MCGLFGVFPFDGITKNQKQRLRSLFLWLGSQNDSRGGHSFGAWGRDLPAHRALGNFGSNLKTMAKYVERWKVEGSSWLCGHTRYATHGAKTVENAHPFDYGVLMLAHNGVLDVEAGIEGSIPAVDSAHLAKYLSQEIIRDNYEHSFEEVFTNTIANVSGSIGLLMSDSVGNLYSYASGQVLHIATGGWGCAISSDETHLEDSLRAAGLDYQTIVQVWEDHLMAPWYSNVNDVFAPAKPSKYWKRWNDYKDSNVSPLDHDYAGATGWGSGNSTGAYQDYAYRRSMSDALNSTSIVKLANQPDVDYPVEEFDGMTIVGGDGDVPPGMGDARDEDLCVCELCQNNLVDMRDGTVWDDPDSGHKYIACQDCIDTFTEIEARRADSTDDLDVLVERYSG